ncbi:MAG: FAD:protein FMN transferase [Oscillospiraceae bacterium]|jgi:thiamine biosynthesis lipoprotein|nr:FAD:protein FMN transferase [Oscillospiraceae bacterium]
MKNFPGLPAAKAALPLWLCAALLFCLSACSAPEPARVEEEFFAMDTLIRLTAYGENAAEAVGAAVERVRELARMASPSDPESDVCRINRSAGKAYVRVHPEILKMIKAAIAYGGITGGVFDITVGPLVALWGIGTENAGRPSGEAIDAARSYIGSDRILLDEAGCGVMLPAEGMSIDLGGIAKGFAADAALEIFRDFGVRSALIDMGASSIYTLGEKPDGTGWSVAVKHPRKSAGGPYLCTLQLSDQALSTSGDYERYFIQDGNRYHHILDPATGCPADSGVMSVTVIVDEDVPDCNMLADILTKAVFIAGVEKGFQMIDQIPGAACLAAGTDFRIYVSGNWRARLDRISGDFTSPEETRRPAR